MRDDPPIPDPAWTPEEVTRAYRQARALPEDAELRQRFARLMGRPATIKELALLFAVSNRPVLARPPYRAD